MHPLPHHYVVTSSLQPDGEAQLTSGELPALGSMPPKEFGGPGDRWSPEGLFAASVLDCFVLNFRAIAAASKLAWTSLEAKTEGVLDRADGKMKFVRIETTATLVAPAGTDVDRATRMLEKAEATCPISNTLNCEHRLFIEISLA